MNAYLLPIAEREPLAWIVAEQRTALPATRRREAEAIKPGDRLFLYTTRGCFHNPTRDRGRVMGLASVVRAAAPLDEPVRFADHEYVIGLDFRIERLAPYRDGMVLADLVKRLESFPDPRSWSARMRRALVPLTTRDAALLERQVAKVAPDYPEALSGYAA